MSRIHITDESSGIIIGPNTKTAVITGAGGMDAKTLARFLQYKDYQIILTYRRNSLFNIDEWLKEVQIEPLNRSKIFFEVCDITDQNSVNECLKNVIKKHGKIDELYLLAAMSHVGFSFTQKEYSIMANGQSYYYFLECLKNHSPNTRTYGAMTSELAGNVPSGTIFNEKSQWNVKSPYSIGKQLGASWIKFYRESTDSNLFACYGILFNHSNIFRTKDFFCSKVCHGAAAISLGLSNELPLGNLEFYRDEHLTDFGVEMMWKMLQQSQPEDYVIGNGSCIHGEQYLNAAFGHFNLDWKSYVRQDKALLRPNEVHRLIADPSKAEVKLGWKKDRISFEDHMKELCNFHYAKLQGLEYKIPNFWEKYPLTA